MPKKKILISLLSALSVAAIIFTFTAVTHKKSNHEPMSAHSKVSTTLKSDKKTSKTKESKDKVESKNESTEQPKEEKQSEVKSETKKTETQKAEPKTSSEPKKQESKPVEKSKATETKKIESKKPVCRTETITIPEQGHNEQYLVSDEVWEDQPVYEWKQRVFSWDTGEDITGRVDEYMKELNKRLFLEGKESHGYYSKTVQIQTGTQRVKVKDAVYGTRWVVDVPAHTETKQVCK